MDTSTGEVQVRSSWQKDDSTSYGPGSGAKMCYTGTYVAEEQGEVGHVWTKCNRIDEGQDRSYACVLVHKKGLGVSFSLPECEGCMLYR